LGTSCDKPQAQLWQATLTLSTGRRKTDGVRKLILTISCSFLTFGIGLGISGVTSTLRNAAQHEVISRAVLPVSVQLPLSPGPLPCEPAPELPSAIKSALDSRFPGWQFPAVSEDICKFLKDYVARDARPELISGDFDGNGRRDYAALVQHGTVTNSEGMPIGHNVYVIAFLKKGSRFKMYIADPEGGEYLVLMRKGKRDYDYETNRYFTYANDGIFAGIFEKAGESYIYENGRFRAIITSD
jgi:hypothetical protein